MERADIERLLSDVELQEVEPSVDFVERVWGEVEPIVASTRWTRDGSQVDGVDPGAELISLDDRSANASARPRLGRRMLATAAGIAIIATGLWGVTTDRSDPVASVDKPLRSPEVSCQILATELDELLDGQLFDVGSSGPVESLTGPELIALADVVGRFLDTTDLAGLDAETRQISVIEGGLRLAAEHRDAGNDRLAARTVGSALDTLRNDDWHLRGSLAGCFDID